jgi:hypothetical protein
MKQTLKSGPEMPGSSFTARARQALVGAPLPPIPTTSISGNIFKLAMVIVAASSFATGCFWHERGHDRDVYVEPPHGHDEHVRREHIEEHHEEHHDDVK